METAMTTLTVKRIISVDEVDVAEGSGDFLMDCMYC